MLSRILQIISLEKYMCWSLFLRKLQDMRPANLLKNDFNTVAFLRNWKDIQEHFFYRTPPAGFKISNSKDSIQRFFRDTSYPQQISYHLQLSQWQTKFKNAFTYQKLVPIERFCYRFRTNSKGTDLNIKNFDMFFCTFK